MRYAVISDIHGNLEAFLKAIENLSEEKVDKVLCAGDVVGYGADPIECIEKTKELDPVIVCGNHDRASCGFLDPRYFNKAAKEAVMWTRDQIGKKEVEFLKELPLLYENKDLTMVHGTLQEPEKFYYMLDSDDALATFGLLKTNICFIGHSHIAGVFKYKNEKITYSHEEKLKLSEGEKFVVNVGSIGQPRDRDPRLCYVLYDTEKNEVEFKRSEYDIEKAQEKILKAGLPQSLAERLAFGT